MTAYSQRSKPKICRVLPTPPGFVLWHIIEEDGEMFAPEPIVGWLLQLFERGDGYVWRQDPITPSGPYLYRNLCAIQWPDGRVDHDDSTTYDNLDEARKGIAEWMSRRDIVNDTVRESALRPIPRRTGA